MQILPFFQFLTRNIKEFFLIKESFCFLKIYQNIFYYEIQSPPVSLWIRRYSVSLRIQSECRKIQTRNYSVFGQFSRSAGCLLFPIFLFMFLKNLRRFWNAQLQIMFQEFHPVVYTYCNWCKRYLTLLKEEWSSWFWYDLTEGLEVCHFYMK